ncbi:hypothetical protein CRENBAI_014858, partial [Crenichthys baileyi]
MHKACRSKLCSRVFPAETLSLRRLLERFPGLKEDNRDRITVVTCSLVGPTERATYHSSG